MEACQLKILNWPNYQAEGLKYKSTSWYRQENTIWQHAIFQLLSGDEYKAKVYIDCQVSQRAHKSGVIGLDIELASRLCGVSRDVIISAIQKLASARLRYLEYKEIPIEQIDSLTQPACTEQEISALGAHTEHAPSAPGACMPLRYDTLHNEEEEISAIKEKPPAADAAPLPDLKTLWNSNCASLPQIERVSSKRLKSWRQRYREHPNPDYWAAVIQRLDCSPFCTGQNKRGWRATPEFLLREDTHVRVMEGQFDAQKPGGGGAPLVLNLGAG